MHRQSFGDKLMVLLPDPVRVFWITAISIWETNSSIQCIIRGSENALKGQGTNSISQRIGGRYPHTFTVI